MNAARGVAWAVWFGACLTGCTVSGARSEPRIDPRSLWLFGLIALVLVAAWIAGRRREGGRRHGVAGVAAQTGFSFEARARLPPALQRFYLFHRPRPRKITNIIRGRGGGMEILCFDYAWHTGGGEPRGAGGTAVVQTVAAFRTSGRTWPSFTLQPGAVLNRVPAWAARALHIVQLDVGSAFSRHYLLRSAEREPAGVRGIFTAAVQSFFAALDAGDQWSVEGGGEWLIVYRNDRITEPAGYEEFVGEAVRVVGILSSAAPQAGAETGR